MADNTNIWTIKKILDWTSQYFEKNHIDEPLLDAQVLLGHVLDMNKVQLIINGMKPLDESELAAFKQLAIKRVKERQPIAYILGHKDFWSLDLSVSHDVLIPRPDTECLVEQALAFIKSRLGNKPLPWKDIDENSLKYDQLDNRQAYYEEVTASESLAQKTDNWIKSQASQFDDLTSTEAREAFEKDVLNVQNELQSDVEIVESVGEKLKIVDVGTGSGAIILALATELQDKCQYTAVDISRPALEIASKNAQTLGLHIDFVESDLCSNLHEPVDVIVSNPPYITDDEMNELSPEVRREPDLALRAGKDGLDVYRRLIPQAYDRLRSGGALFVEIGSKQFDNVKKIFNDAGFRQIRLFKDYGHRPRIVFGLKDDSV